MYDETRVVPYIKLFAEKEKKILYVVKNIVKKQYLKLTENIFILIDFISFKLSMLSKFKKKLEPTLVRTMMPTRLA